MKPTQGPWIPIGGATRSSTIRICAFKEDEYIEVCSLPGRTANSSEKIYQKRIANAKLIASAPDLLEALMELVEQAQEQYPHFESDRGQLNINKANAAICKAQGL
jgi:predicted Rossmann fold nucleotide-binding protein DprA/Smf involved in DNA uptake